VGEDGIPPAFRISSTAARREPFLVDVARGSLLDEALKGLGIDDAKPLFTMARAKWGLPIWSDPPPGARPPS